MNNGIDGYTFIRIFIVILLLVSENTTYAIEPQPFQPHSILSSRTNIPSNRKKALENFILRAETDKNNELVQLQTADMCFLYTDYKNALRFADRAYSLIIEKHQDKNKKDFNQALLAKAYSLLFLNKYTEANNMFFDEANSIFSEVAQNVRGKQLLDAQAGYGHIFLLKHQNKKAKSCFKAILKKNKQHIMANIGMGWAQEDMKKELQYFASILENNETHILALLEKGKTLMGLKRLREAEETFNTILHLDPQNEYALTELGIIAYNKQDDSQAILLFKKALELNNEHYTCPHEGLGLLYLRQGKEKAAEQSLKKSIEINPDIEYKKYNGLAKIYIKKGRTQEAKELLKKSIENFPYDDEAQQLLQKL